MVARTLSAFKLAIVLTSLSLGGVSRVEAEPASDPSVASTRLPRRGVVWPWSFAPGDGYLRVAFNYRQALDYIDAEGNARATGSYAELELVALLQVGVVPGLSFRFSWPPLQLFLLEDPRGGGLVDHAVTGDTDFGLAWTAYEESAFALSFHAGVRVPLARSGVVQVVYGRQPPHPTLGALQVGAGVFDFPVGLSLGYRDPIWYIVARSEFVGRSGDFDQMVRWDLESAVAVLSTTVRAGLSGGHSLPTGNPAYRHQSPSGIGSGTSGIAGTIEFDFPLSASWMVGSRVTARVPLLRQSAAAGITLFVASTFSLAEPRRPVVPPPAD